MHTINNIAILGLVKTGFPEVWGAFIENSTHRYELGNEGR
jgi:hypothetical protein